MHPIPADNNVNTSLGHEFCSKWSEPFNFSTWTGPASRVFKNNCDILLYRDLRNRRKALIHYCFDLWYEFRKEARRFHGFA